MRIEIDPHDEFASVEFSSLSIASADLNNRYSLDTSEPDDHEVLVLSHKRRAHHVAMLADKLQVPWQLVFDEGEGDYILLIINDTPRSIANFVTGLAGLGFERFVDVASS